MATDAMIGFGTVFEMADEDTPTTFVALGEVINVDPGEDDDEEVEATHHASPDRTREYIPGLTTPGEMTVEMNFVPGSATDEMIEDSRGKRNVGRITYPNGVRQTFPIVRRGYAKAIPIDDRMTATATYRRAGSSSSDVASAPVNAVLPAISGVAQVGQTLTVYPGVWAPFGTFTYQWKNEGANIVGATGTIYEPVVGDIGDNITCTVTCTNTGGNASATSAETTPVIAA